MLLRRTRKAESAGDPRVEIRRNIDVLIIEPANPRPYHELRLRVGQHAGLNVHDGLTNARITLSSRLVLGCINTDIVSQSNTSTYVSGFSRSTK